MRPQLVIDCGGRVLTALFVTAEGEIVPFSQEIRQVATRHVATDILFEPRAMENRDFLWEEALEGLSKATARNLFQRASRIGLRRPWDPRASEDALQIVSPLSVLSSAAALADRIAGSALVPVGLTLLDALLDPTFAFLAERGLDPSDVDPIVVLPSQIGRPAHRVLRLLFRRRGLRKPLILRREIAAAMEMRAQAPCACAVIETSETDLHLHRVDVEGDPEHPRLQTRASSTIPALGWNYWTVQIAETLGMTPGAAFERTVTSLLTGSPDSLPPRLTHGALLQALDEQWVRTHDMTDRLRASLEAIDAEGLPHLFVGEIFTIDAIRKVFGSHTTAAPMPDHVARAVAQSAPSHFSVAPSGTLRLNTLRGQTTELLGHEQLPASGESCAVETSFRVAGDDPGGRSFLLHLLWGADAAPEGNSTLCALPMERRDHEQLLLAVRLRRSADGSRLNGTIEARMPRDVVLARARFSQELEVIR
jgi:hypothetical protein